MSESLPDQIDELLKKAEKHTIIDERPPGWFTDDEGKQYLKIVQQHPKGLIVELGPHLGRSLSYIIDECVKAENIVCVVDLWTRDRQLRFLDYLDKMDGSEIVTPYCMDTVDAAVCFNDEEVDVLFIDTLHTYEQTKRELDVWWPKLKIAGDLIGHDYNDDNKGLIQAVDEAFGKPDRVEFPCLYFVKKTCNERKKN